MNSKKVFAGMLSAVLALSGSGITAFAEGDPDATFHNYSIQGVEADLDGSITLDGDAYTGNDFGFHFITDAENPQPSIKEQNLSTDGQFAFGEYTYDRTGTFTYTVEQTQMTDPNIDYDEREYVVTDTAALVENAETGLKELKVTRSITVDGQAVDEIAFENETIPPVPAEASIGISKTMDGLTFEGDAFTFQLRNADGELVSEVNEIVNGKATFAPIEYNQEGLYYYTISEVEGTFADVVYDHTTYGVTVTVSLEQDATGRNQYVARITGVAANEPDAAEFRYFGDEIPADGSIALFENRTIDPIRLVFEDEPEDPADRDPNAYYLGNIYKFLDGELYEGEAHTFLLKDTDSEYQQVITDVENGVVAFEPLEFGTIGEHDFTIEEIRGDDTSIIYDKDVYNLHVEVKREGDELYAEYGYTLDGDPAEGVVFVNMTVENAVIKLLANKNLDAKAYDEETSKEGFEFVLYDEDNNPVQTKKAVSGVISFDELQFNAVGTYTYYVRETKGTDPAINYDESEYKVTINVTRDMDEDEYRTAISYQKKEAGAKTYTDVEVIKFDNKFNPATVKIDGIKTFNALLYTGTEYSYVLAEVAVDEKGEPKKDANGNEITKIIQTATEAKNGVFSFANELSYTVPGIYRYKVYETIGTKTDVVYDTTVFDLTITVTRDAENGITAKKEIKAGSTVKESITFANEPRPIATSHQFTARKTLDGKAYTGTAFTYELYDNTGKRIQANNTAASGTVNFGAIRYDKVGRYTYTIKEQKGTDAAYKYDEREYKVEVEISLDRTTNKLSAKATITTGNTPAKVAEFANFSNKAAPTPSATPAATATPSSGTNSDKTGDVNNTPWIILLGIALAAGIGLVVVYKKKPEDNE